MFEFTAVVPAVIAAASDVDALLVFAFTAVVTPAVCVLVFAFTEAVPAVIAAAIDVEAFVVKAFVETVPAEIAAASDVEAVVTSDCKAKEPDKRELSVRFRIPYDQT